MTEPTKREEIQAYCSRRVDISTTPSPMTGRIARPTLSGGRRYDFRLERTVARAYRALMAAQPL